MLNCGHHNPVHTTTTTFNEDNWEKDGIKKNVGQGENEVKEVKAKFHGEKEDVNKGEE